MREKAGPSGGSTASDALAPSIRWISRPGSEPGTAEGKKAFGREKGFREALRRPSQGPPSTSASKQHQHRGAVRARRGAGGSGFPGAFKAGEAAPIRRERFCPRPPFRFRRRGNLSRSVSRAFAPKKCAGGTVDNSDPREGPRDGVDDAQNCLPRSRRTCERAQPRAEKGRGRDLRRLRLQEGSASSHTMGQWGDIEEAPAVRIARNFQSLRRVWESLGAHASSSPPWWRWSLDS
jgi:hypothetical protein